LSEERFEVGSRVPFRDPRSRIFQDSQSLEDWELVSVVLGSGSRGKSVYSISREILYKIGGIENFPNLNLSQVSSIVGLGRGKISQLIAISELAGRIQQKTMKTSDVPFPFSRIYQCFWHNTRRESREGFYLGNFGLDGSLLRWEQIAKGSLSEVGVYKRDLVQLILRDASRWTLIAHNHPQQSCIASYQDQQLFIEISLLLKELEVDCIDHWVLGIDGLYSCRWEKVLEPLLWSQENIPQEYIHLVDD
jgi:DNA repair protein RadC